MPPGRREESENVSSSVLKWFRLELDLAVDGLDPKGHGVHVVFRSYEVGLLLHGRRQLLERDVRRLAHLAVRALDGLVQPADLLAVRTRRHPYIRINRRGRSADLCDRRRRRRGRRGGHGGLAAAIVERTFLPLAHLAPPHLAVLVVARDQGAEAEAAGVVADLLLAQLVDVGLE